MKHMKKLLSLAMALAMVMALGVSASATKIVGLEGHTYRVYTIFTAETTEDGSLANFNWSSDITPATFIKNLRDLVDSTDEATKNIATRYFAGLTGESSADVVAKAISDAKGNGNDDLVASLVANAAGPAINGTGSGLDKNLTPGYYVLTDTVSGSGTKYAVYEIRSDDASATLTITEKNDGPKPEKKVHANDGNSLADTPINSDSWDYAADYRVGDYIPYKLSTVVTDKYPTVDVYSVTFRDTMDKGLSFVDDAEHPFTVQIVSSNGTVKATVTEPTYNLQHPVSNATFTLQVNLKADSVKNIVAAGDSVVVTYYARLNENAVLGNVDGGNKNHVDLDWTVGEDSGTTPGEDVTVFTFQLVADKVDGNGKPLSGAEFKLEKKQADGTWKEVAAPAMSDADDGTKNAVFTFNTLDTGTYRLVETTAPTGYNKAADLYFVVAPKYNANVPNTTLELEIYAASTTDDGKTVTRGDKITQGIELDHQTMWNTDVVNNSGLTLPSTGGIGTTIFYIVGGLLAAGAVILLITKRRMSLSED